MMLWHRLFFLGILISTTVGLPTAEPVKQHVLSGHVLDPRDNPIPNVRVRLSRGSEPMVERKTGSDGTYRLSFDSGKPIDTVEYELTGWDRAVISGLSGSRDHTVNKTLYERGSGAAQVQKLDKMIMESFAKGDTDLFAKATTDDYIEATPRGLFHKNDILEAYRSGRVQKMNVEFSEIEVRVRGDAAAVLGRMTLTPIGTPERHVSRYRFIRAYANEVGGWKLFASQEMRVSEWEKAQRYGGEEDTVKVDPRRMCVKQHSNR